MEIEMEKTLFMADLATRVGFYKKTIEQLEKVAAVRPLSTAELSNLTMSYNEEIASLRKSWKILCTIEKEEPARYDELKSEYFYMYKDNVGGDILKLSDAFLQTLNSQPETASSLHIKVKLSMYVIEIFNDQKKAQSVEAATEYAKKAYEKAISEGSKTFRAAHPTLLEIYLVAANFAYTILKNPDSACAIACDAIEKAKTDLGKLEKVHIKEAKALLSALMGLRRCLQVKDVEVFDAGVSHWIKENETNKLVLGLGLGEHLDLAAENETNKLVLGLGLGEHLDLAAENETNKLVLGLGLGEHLDLAAAAAGGGGGESSGKKGGKRGGRGGRGRRRS